MPRGLRMQECLFQKWPGIKKHRLWGDKEEELKWAVPSETIYFSGGQSVNIH